MATSNPQLILYLPGSVLAWQAQHPDQRMLQTEATLLVGDITGFTPLVEQRSAIGREGGEEITGIVNRVFTDLLSIAREEGGDVLKFGGDAFLLMFGGDGCEERAAVAALDMQEALTELAISGISMSMGLDSGPVELHLAGDRHRELVVLGEALMGALAAEKKAEAGEVVAGPVARANLPDGVVDSATHCLVEVPDTDEIPLTESFLGETNIDLADYVPESLRPHLTVGGSLGEHRQATIGFLHVAVDPADDVETTSAKLHETMSLVQESAARHEVTFLGSDVDPAGCKVILVAGAPTATRREEERVLRTLHRVIEHGAPLPMRAGVARGVVFAADLGAPFRHSYTVIGDTVNLAARLMGAADEGQLLTTMRVLDRSPTRFRLTQLDPIPLKGKKEPVAAVAVGPITGVDPRDRVSSVPLVGRMQERQVIRDAISDVQAGKGSVVEVVGDAGIGKSRLLYEARDLAGSLDTFTLVCEQYEVNTPYYMAGHLIRGVLGQKPDTPSAEVALRLEEVITEHGPDLEPWMPLIGIPLGIDIPDTPITAEIDPAFRIPRMHEKVEQLLAAAHESSAVIVVEDAHWIDPASAGVLARLVEATASQPWLILVGRRPEGTWVSSPQATVMQLEPLGSDDIGELLRLAAREHPVSDHDLARLADRSAGHPLFALELLEGWEEGDLPDSIEAVIAERIDRLDPRDRQILRYAAVLGSSFTLDLLAEALPAMAHAVEDTETWQRLADFLDLSIPGSVTFRHDLIRAAAYKGLPYRLRREVHGIVAGALERRARRRPERHASLLALHHSEAENWEAAWRFALIAAERARKSFATAEATELYLSALRASDHLAGIDAREVLAAAEALGEMAGLAGKPEVALQAFKRAQQLTPAGSIDAVRLLRRKGALQRDQGDYPSAVALMEKGLTALDSDETAEAAAERVELMLALVGTLYRLGDFQAASDWCRRALSEAQRIDHRSGLAHGAFLMIIINLALGYDDPRDYGAEALQIYEDLGDLVGQGKVWNNLGMAAYYRGDWNSTVEAWERSRDTQTRAGDAAGAATSVNNLGEVFSDRGDLDRAEEMFRDALRAYEAAGFPTGVALATSNLARVEARRGRRRTAVEMLEQAKTLFAELGEQAFVTETQLRIAEAHAFGGAFAEAQSALAEISTSSGVPGLEACIDRIRGVTAWHAGDHAAAESLLTSSVTSATEAAIPYERALSQDLLAKLSGDDATQRAADETLGDLGAMGAPRPPIPQR
ncbi:MAG TPA: tetratricopeptide repeat protein [Acidimicrobiia bacterium]|nr:tetratricopeptide repeat protein [Acidimicrobiia bacterium]